MAKISYIDATCIYQGATAPSAPELSLDVEDGEFMVLVGPIRSGR
jgi:multiple sugar transport system ATP-binding protein